MSDTPPQSGNHEVAAAINRLRRLIHAGFIVFSAATGVALDRGNPQGGVAFLVVAFLFLAWAGIGGLANVVRDEMKAARERG
ncbi:hypothetical protein KBB96_20240 [Luteolibacter ambystomatis]|uniref:Uncharacterized protein n=1 Tax=Luteolibacter ambystomatis TaxID=2824561 RepID=A0A975G9B2_9BACT|nr:hypothetical protein [Luteolibacter ambystomatis]QUE51171.1 hypothetical protein KBB96_20240 [Luteolibacter ambystomatis]